METCPTPVKTLLRRVSVRSRNCTSQPITVRRHQPSFITDNPSSITGHWRDCESFSLFTNHQASTMIDSSVFLGHAPRKDSRTQVDEAFMPSLADVKTLKRRRLSRSRRSKLRKAPGKTEYQIKVGEGKRSHEMTSWKGTQKTQASSDAHSLGAEEGNLARGTHQSCIFFDLVRLANSRGT